MADKAKSPFNFTTTSGAGGPLFGTPNTTASSPNTGSSKPLFQPVGTGSTGLFGTKPSTSTSSTTPFSFTKPSEQSNSSDSQNKPAGPSLFGGGSTTPAAPKTFTLGSTTPAATPPTTNAAKPQSILSGAGSGAGSSNFFSNFGKSVPTTSASSASTSAFQFPAPNNANNTAQAASTPPPASLFPSTAPTSSTPAPASGLFKLGGQTSAATPSSATTTAPPFAISKPASAQTSSTSGLSMPSFAAQSNTSAPTTQAVTATAPPTSGTSTSATTGNTLLSTIANSSTPSVVPSTSAGTSSLFARPPTSGPSTAGSSVLAAPGTGASTFGGTPVAAPASASAVPTIGASTNQTAASRLKNKSMDEILTRWATELSKHQKEFQKQAEQVAGWDRILVENADKISKLVAKTLQAERDATEIERQLSAVESQQEELEQWLDKYEKEADDMIMKAGLTGEATGTDLERERTFKLAEKLTDRLEGLNKDLSDVIEEINAVSALLNNTKGPDDPLSNVVRVLNSHLMQLQKIDMDASVLQAKVKEAQKAHKVVAGGDWRAGSDPTEDFYRSFIRR